VTTLASLAEHGWIGIVVLILIFLRREIKMLAMRLVSSSARPAKAFARSGSSGSSPRPRATRATFYRHFPSKEDLVIAYLRRVDTDVRAGMQAAIEAAPSPPTQCVRSGQPSPTTWPSRSTAAARSSRPQPSTPTQRSGAPGDPRSPSCSPRSSGLTAAPRSTARRAALRHDARRGHVRRRPRRRRQRQCRVPPRRRGPAHSPTLSALRCRVGQATSGPPAATPACPCRGRASLATWCRRCSPIPTLASVVPWAAASRGGTGPRVAVVLSICAVDAEVGSGLPDPLRWTA
jgi:AcrR family transcriptional regulator